MELDEMKVLIRERLDEGVGVSSETRLTGIPKSRSPLVTINRNIRIEMVLYLLVTVAYMVLVLLYDDRVFRIYLFSTTLLCLPFLRVLYSLRRRISGILESSEPVRDSVAELLAVLKRYRRLYLNLGTLLVPICFLYAVLLDRFVPVGKGGVPQEAVDSPLSYWPVVIGVVAVTTGVFYLLNRLYLDWMYGRHIEELEETLAELQRVETE